MILLRTFIILNGIYDIICGFNLIYDFSPRLSLLHTSQLFINIDDNVKRFLGYVLLLFGIIRLSLNYNLICISYLFEAYLFEYELYKNNKNVNILNIRFVSIFSIFLFLVVYYQILFNNMK